MNILLQQFLFISLLAAVMYALSLKPQKRDMVFMALAFIPMWYIHSMINYSMLPDLPNYEYMFDSVHIMSWRQCLLFSGSMEAGYVMFNKLVSFITPSFQVFLGVCGAALLLMNFYAIKKYSPYVVLSVIILLATSYNMSICVLRQYLAVAVFVASFPLILERRMVPYLVVCVLNFFLHRTAILCIPVYFIFLMKPKQMIISMVAFSLVIFLAADTLMLYSIESLEDYQKYMENSGGGQSWLPAAISCIELAAFALLTWKLIWNDDLHRLIFILLTLSFLVNVAIIGMVGTLNRLSTFYGTASLFALPLILNNTKNSVVRVSVAVVILFLKVYPTFFGSKGVGELVNLRLISMF